MEVHINSKEISATGIYNRIDNSLTVKKGSQFITRPNNLNTHFSYSSLLDNLIKNGIISDSEFKQDYKFTSSSAASSIVFGRQTNGLVEWKTKEGISLKGLINRSHFIEFIKDNLIIKAEIIDEYIKTCNQKVNQIQKEIPIEDIEKLPIEKWDKRKSRESLTYFIEYGSNEMFNGFLGTNQNKLIYQNENLEYEATNITMNENVGNTVEEKYKNFIKSIYDSVVRFTDDDYLENTNQYSLVGANVLFTKLLSFYKPKSILLLASPTYYLRIFEYLEMKKPKGDTVRSNIELKKFIYDNISKNTDIYAVSYLIYDFYNQEIQKIYKTEQKYAEVIEDEIEEVDLNHIFISDEKIAEILNVLNRKKNIILQGVPGVGKTFIIKSILKSKYKITEENYQVVQFHQSYSYEEFIEGLRPNNGILEVLPGLFKEFSNRAKNDPENEYFFVIDEINRGNLSKIFGELLMLIEADKREDYNVKLPYSNEEFTIPKNLYIIGTMNTADRSLSLVDYALRRRFAFITLEPAFNTRKFNKYMIEELKYTSDELKKINKTMLEINNTIKDNLSSNFEIGHSYFITNDRSANFDEFLNEIYKYEILPLIEEYFFDDETLVENLRTKMNNYE